MLHLSGGTGSLFIPSFCLLCGRGSATYGAVGYFPHVAISPVWAASAICTSGQSSWLFTFIRDNSEDEGQESYSSNQAVSNDFTNKLMTADDDGVYGQYEAYLF